jgi:hypothetical protein
LETIVEDDAMKLSKRVALCVACVAALLVAAVEVQAAPLVINVGTIWLLPDTPGQTVEFTVSGGDRTTGLNLYIQVGDGGAFLGGTDTAPVITAIELIDGTIFQGLGADQAAQEVHPLVQAHSLDVSIANAPEAEGIFARVTFDTTGLFLGADPIDLRLAGVAGMFDTQFFSNVDPFGPISAVITNGTIEIIPEPSVVALLLVGVGAGLFMRRRRAR